MRLTLAAWLVLLLSGCAIHPREATEAELQSRAEIDLEQMFARQEPLRGPLGFYDAVARAVKYNLDHRLALMEQALASERVVDARLELLPQLVANSDYFGRSNELASSSESITTGKESLEPSTSSERYGQRTDLTLAWNLLDFGVSYVQAAQEANRELVSRARRAKIVQDLMVDVRGAYWQAMGAERLIPEIDDLLREIRSALHDSVSLESEGLVEPLDALRYQRELIEKARELGSMRRKLELARIQLASLVNARPGDPNLVPREAESPAHALELSIEELERTALSGRPELREAAYEERISHLEVRRAMLRLLPGIELRIGSNTDDNDFLIHNDWFSYSALISKNLIQLVTAPSRIRLARRGLEVTQARRLATSVAILAQVHVAYRDFLANQDSLSFAKRARLVEERAHEVTREQVAGESQTELTLIRSGANRLVAEMNYHQSYAEYQQSYGRLVNSVGFLPPMSEAEVGDLALLSDRIRTSLEKWGRRAHGALPQSAGIRAPGPAPRARHGP